MATEYDLGQSFYIDKGAVENASAVHLTSINLYFYKKPDLGKSKSGIYEPGVSVFICPMSNEQPQIEKTIQGSRARVEWASINTDTDAATITKFTFNRPILVATESQYAFLVKFDGCDDQFQLWQAVTGEHYINTSITASPSSGYNDGNLYKVTNGNVFTKSGGSDLKFDVNIAKFTQLTNDYSFQERKYELIKYYANSITGDFKTGEYVYKNTSPSTGNAVINSSSYTIVGQNGTTFNSTFVAGDYIVFSDGTATNTAIRVVSSVSGASSLVVDELVHFSNSGGVNFYKTVVGKVYSFGKTNDHMLLTDSNANSTLYLTNNDYIKGEDSKKQVRIQELENLDIGRVASQFNIVTPALTLSNTFANFSNSTYYATQIPTSLPTTKRQFIDTFQAIVGSRSLVQSNTATALASGNVTVDGTMTFTTSNKYSSPYIEEQDLDLLVYRYIINNDATNEEIGQGNAMSRYISKRVVLGYDQDAEDLRTFITAYLPKDTSVKIYARLVNNQDYENIETKNWTPLEEFNSTTYASSPRNKNDTIDKEYGIPYYHSDGTTLSGYCGIQVPNNVITTTSDLSGNLTANSSLVRIYQDGTPNNFFVSVVASVNSTAVVIADTISNSSFSASGLKIEKISETNKHSAFINPQNKNVVRYYTNDMAPMDTYKTFLIKIVQLSPYNYSVPLIKDVRALAVSA